MTEQQIDRDRLRAVAHHAEQANSAVYLTPRDLLALLDQLTRAEAQSEVRRLDIAYWRERAQEFEARIKAVQDVLDRWQVDGYDALQRRIRRALDGER